MNGVELNDGRELLGHKKMEMTLRFSHLGSDYVTKSTTGGKGVTVKTLGFKGKDCFQYKHRHCDYGSTQNFQTPL